MMGWVGGEMERTEPVDLPLVGRIMVGEALLGSLFRFTQGGEEGRLGC